MTDQQLRGPIGEGGNHCISQPFPASACIEQIRFIVARFVISSGSTQFLLSICDDADQSYRCSLADEPWLKPLQSCVYPLTEWGCDPHRCAGTSEAEGTVFYCSREILLG